MSEQISRRGFVRVAAAGAAVTGSGLLAAQAAAQAAPNSSRSRGRPVKTDTARAAAPNVTGNPVSLYCSVAASTDYDSSGTGSFTILCGNDSANATTGPISLKFLSPFLTSVSTSDIAPPRGWTVTELFNDNDSTTPSLFKIGTSSPLAARATVEATIKVHIAANTPNRTPEARAIFSTDASNTTDYDTDLIQNYWTPGLDRTVLAHPTPGNANLIWTSQTLPFVPGGTAKEMQFSFYDYAAGLLLDGTQSTSFFYFSTAGYVSVASSGRPPGLTVIYENSDPAIPSIYQLAVPAGVGTLGFDSPTNISIPFQVGTNAVSGLAPLGPLVSQGIYVTSGSDTQGDLSTAHHAYTLVSALKQAV